jgi:hypothetical protein
MHLYVPNKVLECSTPPPPPTPKIVANLKRLAKLLKGQDLIEFMGLVGMEQLTTLVVALHLVDVHIDHVETIGSSKGAKEKKDKDKAKKGWKRQPKNL